MGRLQTSTITLAACAVLSTATACGSSSDSGDGDDTSEATATVTSTPATTSTAPMSGPGATAGASGSRLDRAVRAVRTAEGKVSGGEAYDIESDRLRGRRIWEVKVARGTVRPYEVDVSADRRNVVRQRRRAKVDDHVRKLAGAKITLAKALRTAAGRASGGVFDEAEIDRSGGRIVWEASFDKSGGREVEVDVDARTGKVVAVKHDA